MRIHREQRDGAARLLVEGAIDFSSSPELRFALRDLTRTRSPRIEVALGTVSAIDSSGVATLVAALREARRQGGDLVLTLVDGHARSMLRLTETEALFAPLPASVGEAVTARGRELVIEAEGLAKRFEGRDVLNDVSFSVRAGETLVIMGRSGSGKTTCLRILMGQERPDRGAVRLFSQDIAGLSRKELAAVRRRFGVVFQSGALLNSLSVHENVALPLHELTDLDEEVVGIMVKMKLEKVGLRDSADLLPDQLSGGMKKRVGIARALIMDPEVLFYDEPTAGLDPVMTAVINQLIREIAQTLNVASVVVTHDMESAFKIADRIIMLFEGKVVAAGTPDDVRRSDDPILRQFVDGDEKGPVSFRTSRSSLSEDLLGD